MATTLAGCQPEFRPLNFWTENRFNAEIVTEKFPKVCRHPTDITTVNENTNIYRIPSHNVERLLADIAKLNRRATKLGVPAITVETVQVEDETYQVRDEVTDKIVTRVRQFHHLRIVGQTPKFAGWTFAATISVTEEGNVLRTAPGLTVDLKAYRDCRPGCDHCQTNRFRRETFVVLHEDGSTKQVGRQCLRDFLGHADPHSLAQWAELIFSLGELSAGAEDPDFFGGGFGSRRTHSHTESFLKHCAVHSLREGFRTRKQAELNQSPSTRDDAFRSMYPNPMSSSDRKWLAEINFEITPEAEDLAAKAQELVLTKLGGKADLSDFEHNLLTLAKTTAFEDKNGGIVAYIIGWYLRETERDAYERKTFVDGYFGELKKRYKAIPVTYLGSSSFDSQYGTTWVHRLVSKDGYRMVWKTGNPIDAENGTELVLDLTVKEHSTYNDKKQTVITRCKIC